MRKVICFIILLLSLFETAVAQKNYHFSSYGTDYGLSQSNIYTIAQDTLGFIWMGTAKGLNRFDGQTFKTYLPPKDSLQNGMLSQEINDIIQDKEGKIWVATLNGLSMFDPEIEQFTNFNKAGNCENCLAKQQIAKLLEDENYIWIATVAGLSRIEKNNHTITSWIHEEGNPDSIQKIAIRDLLKIDNNTLLLATSKGLSLFNIDTQKFLNLTTENGLLENQVQSIHKDAKNRIWIGYETKGFSNMHGKLTAPEFDHFPAGAEGPSHGFIYDFEEDAHGNIWIATFRGLTIFNPEKKTFHHIFKDDDSKTSLASNQILSLLRDDDDRMWIGTQFGVNVMDPYMNQFQYKFSEKNNPNSLASNETFAIYEDTKGALWVGNYTNGLTVIQNINGEQRYHHITSGTGDNYLSGAQILDFEEDSNGDIWVATFNGLNIIHWTDRSNYNYTISKPTLQNIPINAHLAQYMYTIEKAPDDTMWISTHGAGVLQIDEQFNTRQYTFEDTPKGIMENVILNMEFDEKGRLWLGHTIKGLSIIENSNEGKLFKKPKSLVALDVKGVHKIILGTDNSILIGSDTGLIVVENKEDILTKKNLDYTRYDETNGLSNDVIYGIEKISNTAYWISTGNGISMFDSEKNTVFPIIDAIGNSNREFNQNAAWLSKDKTVYFGGIDGVVSIRPDTFRKNKVAPRLYFSEAKILNEPIPISTKKENDNTTLSKHIRYVETLVLKPQDKIISFTLQAVGYTVASRTNFSYKLEGFDNTWTETSNPIITRSNLDPGTYTLVAKASNNDGTWSTPISLQIKMLPPWYKTWWAYILFALLLGLAVYALLKLRLQQERKVELARAQERDIFRKRSSRDFHDEAGTKITRISLITELARIENVDNKQLQQYLNQIDDNVQDLNSGMRDFIWTLDPTKDNAYDTLTRYTEFAGKFCEYANIQFQSAPISEELKSKELNMAERRHLLMILKEATNNCIKHGNPTTLLFSAKHKPGKLSVSLKDNGSGFDVKNANNGNGLTNMQERAEALGGALKITSKSNGGTTLTLTLETTRLGN